MGGGDKKQYKCPFTSQTRAALQDDVTWGKRHSSHTICSLWGDNPCPPPFLSIKVSAMKFQLSNVIFQAKSSHYGLITWLLGTGNEGLSY